MTDEKPPLIQYPTTYAFKVMGKQEPDFRDYVRELFVRLIGAELSADAVQELVSQKGTFVSLTVSVWLESEDQRRVIYGELHKEKRIVYYL